MYTIWKTIINIFKQLLRAINFTRIFITNLFLLITIGAGITIYIRTYHYKPPAIKGALIVDIVGTIVDQPAMYNKIQQFKKNLFRVSKNQIQENSLFAIIDALRHAKNDKNITGLILSLKNLSNTDQTSLEYIGKILKEFQDTGKPIYAIGDNYTQTQYFLASYANKIYLTPQGSIELQGFATQKLYYKTLLDKLKIDSHIFRIGTYKSAVEPFLRNNMSNPARDIESQWIYQIWQNYLNIVSNNRKITTKQLFPGAKKILNDLDCFNGNHAEYALKNKWIDEIISNTDLEKIMKKHFGWNKKNDSFNSISIYDYHPSILKEKEQKNQIGIIIANGAIIDGEDISGWIGGDTITEKIRHARLNPKIKALILRINSPGGSVNASELIRSELVATRNYGKPIVVSMGGIAASGGYWISTPANAIIANDSTLTGSIGIFGIINTFENFLNNIGIYTDGISTSPLVSRGITKTPSTEYMHMIQININNAYHHFITTVAESRNKTLEDIKNIAQGQVWTGKDAIEYGLIDYLGDFDLAVKKAAELANLQDFQLNWYLEKPKIIDVILTQIMEIFYTQFIQQHTEQNNLSCIYKCNHNLSKHICRHDIDLLHFKFNDPKHCYALSLVI